MTEPTVWKYLLPITDEHVVEIPRYHQVLSVDIDPSGAGVAVWVWVNPDQPQMPHRFYVRGTGHPAAGASLMSFIGTAVDRATGLVWHVFDGGAA